MGTRDEGVGKGGEAAVGVFLSWGVVDGGANWEGIEMSVGTSNFGVVVFRMGKKGVKGRKSEGGLSLFGCIGTLILTMQTDQVLAVDSRAINRRDGARASILCADVRGYGCAL